MTTYKTRIPYMTVEEMEQEIINKIDINESNETVTGIGVVPRLMAAVKYDAVKYADENHTRDILNITEFLKTELHPDVVKLLMDATTPIENDVDNVYIKVGQFVSAYGELYEFTRYKQYLEYNKIPILYNQTPTQIVETGHTPKYDLYEDMVDYVICISLPGMSRRKNSKYIEIILNDNTLSVSNTKKYIEDTTSRYINRIKYPTSFNITFNVEHQIDIDRSYATLNNGMLYITLLKTK